MPTLLVWRGYKFRFYALDMDEPPHVHIVRSCPDKWCNSAVAKPLASAPPTAL